MKDRFFNIIFILIAIGIIFGARLAYLQLFTDRYALNAANTSIKIDYDIPQRGVIFDRNGKIMVGNQPSYEIQYTPVFMKKDFDTLGFCNLMHISKLEFIQRMKAITEENKKKKLGKLLPAIFQKNISREEVARIQEIIFKYPAFTIVKRPQRQYEVNTSGNLLGYTSEVNDSEIKKDSVYYRKGDLIGKTGVEKSYEKILRGEKGLKYIQKDIHLRDVGPYRDGKLDVPKVTGKDLTLTIDYDLQKMAEEMLVNKHGAIVAIDPKTGEILVLASGPDVDPNAFVGPEKSKNIYNLTKDSIFDNNPLLDRSTSASFPPGSTFKLLTALSGMQMGVFDEKTVFPCGGGFHVGGVRIKGHGGAVPLVPAIEVSSNCYFSHAYLAILNKYPGNPSKGVDEWAKIMESFGLNKFMNNDLATGAKGFIPDGKYYQKRYGKNWKPLQAVFNGMGQGEILITPLQLANFTAAIANDGWYITPHIVKSIDGKPNPDPRFKTKHQTLVQNKKFYEFVKQGMDAVMQRGTGAGLKTKEFTQLAKTGTAQVPQGQDNSIFTLIAPADNPKIVVAAIIEHAGFGATWAGPACSAIAEKYITGNLKREHLYKKMVNASMMPEYKRQWYKKYGKPEPDSATLKRIKDSLVLVENQKNLLLLKKRQDSIQKSKNSTKNDKASRSR